jgi:hypothetical protein
LGLAPDDERVAAAVDAAISLTARYVYGTAPTVEVLPLDDPAVSQGLVAFAVRLHMDARSPAGIVESDVFSGVTLPADLLTAVHDYFDWLRTTEAFGVA